MSGLGRQSVEVAVRIRPLTENEEAESVEMVIEGVSDTKIHVDGREFNFDHVFGPTSEQQLVYSRSVESMVESFVQGYNVTVFAYGQTGSGKTYTMGTNGVDSASVADADTQGIISRAIESILERIDELKEENKDLEVYLRIQFLEVYGEELRDLLSDSFNEHHSLQIRENALEGVTVKGATEEPVKNAEEMFAALEKGSLNRTTASTNMNSHSSRSHAIFTILMEQHIPRPESETSSNLPLHTPKNGETVSEKKDNVEYRLAKFHFVDLAGSERAKRTGAEGKRLKEGININMGLLALGNVISALSSSSVSSDGPKTEGRKKQKLVSQIFRTPKPESHVAMGRHIPYRSSKLTRILQDSLGGNSQTLMICCVSPSALNAEESLNALRYASRARNIKNKPIVNKDPTSSQIALLKQEIMLLRSKLGEDGIEGDTGVRRDEDVFVLRSQLKFAEEELRRTTARLEEEKHLRSSLQEKHFETVSKLEALCEIHKEDALSSPSFVARIDSLQKLHKKVAELEDENKELKRKGREEYPSDSGSLESAEVEDIFKQSQLKVDYDALQKEIEEVQRVRDEVISPVKVVGDSDKTDDVDEDISESDEEGRRIKAKFVETQGKLVEVINSYNNSLKEKESMINNILKERREYQSRRKEYEVEISKLRKEVQETMEQKKNLDVQIMELSKTQAVARSKGQSNESYVKELERLKGEVVKKDSKMKALLANEKKLKQLHARDEKWAKKEAKVLREIESMKKQKVDCQKQMEENNKKYRFELGQRRREIAQLRKKQLTLEREKSQFERRCNRDEMMLKNKSDRLLFVERQLRERQKIGGTMRSSKIVRGMDSDMQRKINKYVKREIKMKDENEEYKRLLRKKDAALLKMKRIILAMKKRQNVTEGNTSLSSAAAKRKEGLAQLFKRRNSEEESETQEALHKKLVLTMSEVDFREEQLKKHVEKNNSKSNLVYESFKLDPSKITVETIDELDDLNLAKTLLKSLLKKERKEAVAFGRPRNSWRKENNALATLTPQKEDFVSQVLKQTPTPIRGSSSLRENLDDDQTEEDDSDPKQKLYLLEKRIENMRYQFGTEKKARRIKSWASKGVFDRLTNMKHFTGIQKNKFRDLQKLNGKDRSSSVDSCEEDKENRTDSVNSSAGNPPISREVGEEAAERS